MKWTYEEKNGVTKSFRKFRKIISVTKWVNHKPSNLQYIDKGFKFGNTSFKSMLKKKKYNIKIYHTENGQKLVLV